MVNVYGKQMTKRDFYRYFGDPSAYAAVIPSVLDAGKGTGTKSLRIYTGAGLDFTVLPGRAMDIAWTNYQGKSLVYMAKPGITHPRYYESQGLGFLRGFFGGLLTTCGMTYFGAPNVDNGVELGLHGRASFNEAEDVSVKHEWEGDDLYLSVEGSMREARVFGENIIMRRRISVKAGENVIKLEDRIENLGFEAQPFMLLYHINYGFPLLSPECKLYSPSKKVIARDADAEANDGVAKYAEFQPATAGYKEQVFFHEVGTDTKGNTMCALINETLNLGILQKWNVKELPEFVEWKNMLEGDYVLGLEPGTATPIGRSSVREQGKLLMIQPGETKHVSIEISVLDSKEQFTNAISQIKKLVS